MIYSGISESIRTQGVPPENPYFAGQILHYPWGGIWFNSLLRTPLSLTYGHAASLNVAIAYILFWILSYKLSITLYRNSKTAKFALILATIAPTWVGPTVNGFRILGEQARSITPALIYERYDQWPLAWTMAVMVLLLMVQSLKKDPSLLRYISIPFLVAGSIFFYPFCLLFLLPLIGATAYLIRIDKRKRNFLILSILMGILLVSPYLILSTTGRSTQGGFSPDLHWWTVLFQLRDFTFIAIVPLVFIPWRLWKNVILITSSEKTGMEVRFLLLCTIPCMGLLFFVHFPGMTHYKLRVMTVFLLSLVAAPYFRAFFHHRKWMGIVLILLLLFPYSIEIYRDWYGNLQIHLPMKFHADHHGRAIQQDDQKQEAYDWIIQNTPVNSVWIDFENAYLPVFTGRSLYIAQTPTTESLFGWTMNASFFLEDTCGVPAKLIEERAKQIHILSDAQSTSEILKSIILQIENQIQNRPFYSIQSIDRPSRGHLGNKVFENKKFKIFQINP